MVVATRDGSDLLQFGNDRRNRLTTSLVLGVVVVFQQLVLRASVSVAREANGAIGVLR